MLPKNAKRTHAISGSRFPLPRLTKWPPVPVLIERLIMERIRLASSLLEAIEEAKRLEADPKTKRYTDMAEMWADMDK